MNSEYSLKGLLARLVDDAGLFPPEQLPMGEALARHWADEMSPSPGRSMLTHRFLCPASRLGELRAEPTLQRWTVEPERLGLRNGPGLLLLPGLDLLVQIAERGGGVALGQLHLAGVRRTLFGDRAGPVEVFNDVELVAGHRRVAEARHDNRS